MTPELKELLTLAAKAAGIKILKWCEVVQAYEIDAPRAYWDPTVDDEDLFYLARDAKLQIDFDGQRVWYSPDGAGIEGMFYWDDNHESMCMAIVRAAAEKGRAMG